MTIYKTLYFTLLRAIADAIDAMDADKNKMAKLILIRAIQQAEESYISAEDDPE